MAIFITGDIHGDFTRFNTSIFYEQKGLTKEDFAIICGDFGIWDHSAKEQYWLKWLNAKLFTTLFVSGNHENYDLLDAYPIEQWHGGQVQFIQPSVIHLMRGQIFHICGKTFFTMGGARSHDIADGILELDDPQYKQKYKKLKARGAMFRINHISWWKRELPSAEEYQAAVKTLEAVDWCVDYIITHCCSTSIQNVIGNGQYEPDVLTDFLEMIQTRCQFQYWFFGHYHRNCMIQKKFVLLYEQIIALT